MGKKILIVDDSRTIRQQLRFTLEKSDFEVVEAENGVEGLAKLAENTDAALVISDVNMPEKDGLEMVEDIRGNASYAEIPILMLTTEGGGELIERAKKAGVKGWLVKPFQPDQLTTAVKRLTGS